MCQLLGLNANVPTDAMFSFCGLSERAVEHRDGFGIAFFEGVGMRVFQDAASARESKVAEFIRTYPIRSRNIVGHIRKATQGQVELANTHPFTRELWGRHWVFAHNGNLKDYAPHLHSHFQPVGSTDSERAFCWLMQEMHKAHARFPGIAELTLTLRELVPQIAAHGTFNLLLTNGDALWAHANTDLHYVERRHPFGVATLCDADLRVDFSQVTTENDRVVLLATQPLTANEQWTRFASGELLTFVDGSRYEVQAPAWPVL
ncbi:class II glutamine amidotransferase [Amphibiibacter pelophylacis]|uniref:Class II glutamine amidotransferase n=1 Tax=Amphibiibacter pelophylacis TaxID=1799477 RepID=A0ACC6P3B9_9BURK